MRRDGPYDGRHHGNVTVLKKIALPIMHFVALVCCANVEIVCFKNRHGVARDIARDVARALTKGLHSVTLCV